MRALLSCDAVTFWAPFEYGRDVIRVAARRADTCVLQYWTDIEGHDGYSTCELPLPLAPWAGLRTPYSSLSPSTTDLIEGIRDKCTLIGTCCTPFMMNYGAISGGPCDPTFVPAPYP